MRPALDELLRTAGYDWLPGDVDDLVAAARQTLAQARLDVAAAAQKHEHLDESPREQRSPVRTE